ncbi:hypothetical protein F5B20DRAFT_565680 [Whalleya microplaca]|nr:hypothetical protein F5B20DRAFT_565680 [Whalleya microplaca]
MDLLVLSDTPQRYPGCCLSLSNELLNHLGSLFKNHAKSGLILSIGSGTGLLEELLHAHLNKEPNCKLRVEGVEVPSTNIHLPEDRINVVNGTWAICRRAADSVALVFVYPRSAELVNSYVDSFLQKPGYVKLALWLGPKADWEEFAACFRVPGFEVEELQDGCGLVEYEMMTVLRQPKIQSL